MATDRSGILPKRGFAEWDREGTQEAQKAQDNLFPGAL
jgi:hypothetical protein